LFNKQPANIFVKNINRDTKWYCITVQNNVLLVRIATKSYEFHLKQKLTALARSKTMAK